MAACNVQSLMDEAGCFACLTVAQLESIQAQLLCEIWQGGGGGGGGGAPTNASYVVMAANATLTDERILTGTANRVIVTDGGAGGAVTLSTPQDIHTGASPTFAGLTLNGHLLFGANNLYDIGTFAVRLRDIYAAGNGDFGGTVTAGTDILLSGEIYFGNGSSSRILGPVNGNILLQNDAGTTFGMLQFGGTTAAFPALKRSAATLQVRLADDSADANFSGGQLTLSGDLLFTPNNIWNIGAAGGTRPHNIYAAGNGIFDGTMQIGAAVFISAGVINFGNATSSRISGPTDGNIILQNQAATDFGLLQLGGTTSAFPALKRSTTTLQARLADDSDFAQLTAKQLLLTQGTITADTKVLDATSTWNAGGVTFTAWKLNVTDTASAAGSLLLDLQVGASSKWSINKTGLVTWVDDIRQTFNPGANNAGLNVGSLAGDPATPSNGDIWYDSTANELTARINGANVALGAGGGGTPGGADTQVQFNNAGAFGGDAGFTYNQATDLITSLKTAIGATPADSLQLINTTAAAAGAQQYSPALRFTGQGWKTTAVAASQAVDCRIYLQPVQGAGNPAANLLFDYSVNAGAFSTKFTFDLNTGNFTAVASITASTGNIALSAAGLISWSGRSRLASPADSQVTLLNAAQTDFGRLNFGGTTSSFPALARTTTNLKVLLADGTEGGGLLHRHVITIKTIDYTVTTAETNSVFTNEGAVGTVNFTLPGAAAGLVYTFYIQAAQTLTVTAAGGDTVRIAASVSAAAGNASASTVGNSVTFQAINATEWVAIAHEGTWTVT